jgi:hypothetical protein
MRAGGPHHEFLFQNEHTQKFYTHKNKIWNFNWAIKRRDGTRFLCVVCAHLQNHAHTRMHISSAFCTDVRSVRGLYIKSTTKNEYKIPPPTRPAEKPPAEKPPAELNILL